MSGDLLPLVPELPGDHRRRRARRRRGPRCVRPQSIWRVVRVAVLDQDVLGRDSQLLGHDLGERGLVSLALGLHSDLEDRLAGRMDAKFGRVEHLQAEDVVILTWARPDDLGEGCQPDAEQPALLPGSLLLLHDALPIFSRARFMALW